MIVVYQGDETVHEDVALGYLADGDGTVQLTFACVPVVHSSKARAALSRAQVYANVGRWDYWRKWQAEAERLEQVAADRARCWDNVGLSQEALLNLE